LEKSIINKIYLFMRSIILAALATVTVFPKTVQTTVKTAAAKAKHGAILERRASVMQIR
jgi:hypothetical protein